MTPKIILDAHLDIAMNHVCYGRDFRNPTWVTRRKENKFPGHPFDPIGVATVGLPDLILGRVAVICATLWAMPAHMPNIPLGDQKVVYETPRQAHDIAMRQLDYYHRLEDEDPHIKIIRTQADLDAVLATWTHDSPLENRQVGMIILMEGADPILEPQQVEEWYERDVRMVGPAWAQTRYSGGTAYPGGLSSLGHELLEHMADLNMIVDLSHLAEEAYLEVIDRYPGALLATHSNPRRFVNTDRHLSDDMIRRLAERDSVMGIVPYNVFLLQGWLSERDRKGDVSVSKVLDMIDHVCQVTGSSRHVGLGTDWDGGFGSDSIPVPFDSHIELWNMGDYLQKRGYSDEDVSNILSGNFLRILRQGLPA
jgi:membrane dipeptidase